MHPTHHPQSIRIDIDPATLDVDVTTETDDLDDTICDMLGELTYALTTGQARAALETAMILVGAIEPPVDIDLHIGLRAYAERRAA